MKLSKVPHVATLQKEIGPGKCPFCEDRIEPRPTVYPRRSDEGSGYPIRCDDDYCKATYNRLYRTFRSEKNWAKGLNALGQEVKRGILGHRASE